MPFSLNSQGACTVCRKVTIRPYQCNSYKVISSPFVCLSGSRSYSEFVMAAGGKQTLTPKAIIHQKFGVNASYKVEEVHDSSQNGCPGLAIPQKGPCLYRCHLQLPDFSVVSDVFKRKKDSEQSAAELALEKLGIRPRNDDLTVDEAWDDFIGRIKYIFSDEFLSTGHPLVGHLRAALLRDGDGCGSVPVSVIATFDAKINSRCKVINPSVESDPFVLMPYVMKAAEKLSDYIVTSPNVTSLRRKNAYPSANIEALGTDISDSLESIKVKAVRIPCISEEVVEPVTLNISSSRYYLDIIAEKLGLADGSQLMISRTFGKASSGSECRLYSAIPKVKSEISLESPRNSNEETSHFEKSLNLRASYVCGQDIQGDAILASVSYPWKSYDIDYADVTVNSFYRICCGMSPSGIYKIARKALISVQLPLSFTTKSNWRGPLPREILCTFCRQHQLAEPVFSISTVPMNLVPDIRSHKKLKVSVHDDAEDEVMSRMKEDITGSRNGFKCEVKILSKSQDLVLDCSLRRFYEKESDAIQTASLEVLLWFSRFFNDLNWDSELPLDDDNLDIQSQKNNFIKEISPHTEVNERPPVIQNGDWFESMTMHTSWEEKHDHSITNGSLVSICYSVSLVAECSSKGEYSRELIESNEDIEFEVGVGALNPHLESVVTQMSVGQYACYSIGLPAESLVLATATDTVRARSLLSGLPSLEYSVLLLRVQEPAEERMEEAFFKPPLSKQRVEYALKHIRESSASTLVDFGCGSGSLLDSLLDYPTSLQTIVGVDISLKGLARAAKMLHNKLNKEACNVESATLYDGSILKFDSRLYDVDIGTCLEVIEHMEEHQACEFGETVLSFFLPKLLIVSTPNYEYNTILQRSTPETQEQDHPEDKSDSQLPKFRNHDHKFEWTREQFNNWASNLAKRYNYSVEFSGVGGSGDVEPGFASQIAVFRREFSLEDSKNIVQKVEEDSMQRYNVIWQWSRGNGDNKD